MPFPVVITPGIYTELHDSAATAFQFPKDSWEILLDCSLDLVVLVMLLRPSLLLLPWIAALLVLRTTLILRVTLELLLSLWLAVVLLPMVLLASAVLSELRRHLGSTPSQINVDPACICLCRVL